MKVKSVDVWSQRSPYAIPDEGPPDRGRRNNVSSIAKEMEVKYIATHQLIRPDLSTSGEQCGGVGKKKNTPDVIAQIGSTKNVASPGMTSESRVKNRKFNSATSARDSTAMT